MRLLVSGSIRTVAAMSARWPDRLGAITTPSNRNGVAALVSSHLPWAIDNGAFSGFNAVAFRRLLRCARGRPRLLWIVCPDAVGDARGTLALFEQWRDEVAAAGPVAFVGQDGQEDLAVPWERCDAFFAGGSTDWKLSAAAADLIGEARQRGKHVHMGRVNTLRRMRRAHELGCDSIDGSIFSRMSQKFLGKSMAWMNRIHEQPLLFPWESQ